MGFSFVYRTLMEIYPQVDWRILKAVAIEHPKDIDAAAEIVLTEVVPFLSEESIQVSKSLSDGEGEQEQSIKVKHSQSVSRTNECSSSGLNSVTGELLGDISLLYGAHDGDSACPNISSKDSLDAKDGNKQLSGCHEGEELILLKAPENRIGVGVSQISNVMSTSSVHQNGDNVDDSQLCTYTRLEEPGSFSKSQDASVNVPTIHAQESCGAQNSLTDPHHDWKDSKVPDANLLENCVKGQEELYSTITISEAESVISELVPDYNQEHVSNTHEYCPQSEVGPASSDADDEKTDGFIATEIGDVDTEDMSTLRTILTQSGKLYGPDLLEEIIEDAKNNKKTLFSAMESVMNMMREVELKEKAAEQAKEEAARGGVDILIKVEELKQMLKHATEANDMHAGEVYGEKAILATEVRELQTRLLSLSEERDKFLAILNEMFETLQARLATAEEARRAAEQEKLEKEESARVALAEQEAIMEKIVQESKMLEQQADENSKLREFLIDRGHVVDSLQGEISVICQDVRLLKEKFDDRVPLSKSISSSQTSCILASSGSSVRSNMASDLVPEPCETLNLSDKRSSTSIKGESPKSGLETEKTTAERKELLEDGWDFFDNDIELYNKAL